MKIITKVGNLLDVTKGHIVHGCNAQGVMGSGVARAIRDKYPACYEMYLKEYNDVGLTLGDALPWSETDDFVIWNAITQEGFGNPGRNCSYDAIESCFGLINRCVAMDQAGEKRAPGEIHIPMIGAGLGGGNWEIIREIIEQTVTFPTTLWVLQ